MIWPHERMIFEIEKCYDDPWDRKIVIDKPNQKRPEIVTGRKRKKHHWPRR